MPVRALLPPSRLLRPLLALAALLLAAAPTAAATLKVPGQYPTIQSAVNAASAGDTILVAAGVYAESVTVPAQKSGLSLVGKGTAVIDPGGSGFGLRVHADGVRLRRLTIRHAPSGGVVVRQQAGGPVQGATLERITVHGSGGPDFGAVWVEAHEARLDRVTVSLSTAEGITVLGSGARVQRCVADRPAKSGLRVMAADGALVQRCEVRGALSGVAFHVEGHGAQIDRNVVTRAGPLAVLVLGDDVSVTRNVVRDGAAHLVQVIGAAPIVSRNLVSGAGPDATGLLVLGTSQGGRVEHNDVRSMTGRGLLVDGRGSIVRNNRVEDCGSSFAPAIDIPSQDATIESNRVTRAGWVSIVCSGSGALLKDNLLRDGGHHGILVASAAAILDRNRVLAHQGDGVQNHGSGTLLRRNTIVGNRLDITNSASLTIEASNTFHTGGADTPPGP